MNEDTEYKYAIAFYLPDDPDKILHIVYYPEPPSSHDYFHLGVELATDKEFRLTEVAHKLVFREATEEDMFLAEFYKEIDPEVIESLRHTKF